jgi:hypothetical protein
MSDQSWQAKQYRSYASLICRTWFIRDFLIKKGMGKNIG